MTVVRIRPFGARLLELLRGAHDDGQPPLRVLHDPPALIVLRADGSELSETEALEVRALHAPMTWRRSEARRIRLDARSRPLLVYLYADDDSALRFNLHSVVHLAHTAIALRATATIREVGTERVWTFGSEHRKGNAMTQALRTVRA